MNALRPWRRLLDGDRRWGSLRIYAGQYGVIRYRLVVFPPGISPDERMLLRVWRSWPTWGAVVWLVAQIWLTRSMSPAAALTSSTALLLGTGAVAMALAGTTRTRVRTLSAVVMLGFDYPEARNGRAELLSLAELLTDADAQLEGGQISAAEHEAVVWRVYHRMGVQQCGVEPPRVR